MMFIAAGVAILVAIFLFLLRALLGPTTYDRILALNAIGTKTVILVSLMGFIGGRPDFLDIALLYALMNFIATIAILKFVEYKRLG
ncbi:MAG: monovalent cation/H+ antiporter complex subunit F [Sulfuricaulis sp.]|jgi:multicomponent Na+:H+ antiporter subunit F|uniref:monovalent cation/H+ antiporter complex subunit F n=1 Tax=Sulfuricaulis sp. TaxID=2003553 RepID=UPI002B822C97|nr:monovalent cation/H+ antiporter complex subunit F [Sulfuricaulis sp.]